MKKIRDKYFILTNNEIVEVNKIVKYLNGQIKLIVTSLSYCVMYQNPISSYLIKSFYINNNSNQNSQTKLIDFNCLKNKCLYIPTNTKSVAIALLHEF
jgi:hypothetical protein